MRRLLLLAGILTMLVVLATAQRQWVGFTTDSPQKPQLTLGEQNQQHVVIDIDIPGMFVSTVTEGGQTFQRIELIEDRTTKDVGMPELPMISELIGIPGNQIVNVKILEKQTIKLSNYKIYPFQTPTTDNPGGNLHEFVIDQKFYNLGNSYPGNQVFMDKPGIWRDVKVAGVHVIPFEYNTANNELEVITSIKLEIEFAGVDPNFAFNPNKQVSPKFYTMYNSKLLNFGSLGYTKNFLSNDDIKYLIITNDEAVSSIQPLVDWKNQQGYRVEVRTMESGFNTPQNFKDYIAGLYASDNLEYILMVGDAYPNGGNNGGPNDVPMFWWAPSGEDPTYSDSWYSCMDGPDDHFADIAIGRIVYDEGALDQLQLQIQKTMDYYFTPDQSSWPENSILIAHQEEYPGKYTLCSEQIRTFPYALQTPIFEQAYGGAGYTNTQVVNYVNANSVGIFNYRGHGSATELWQWGPTGSFTAQHVNQLTNEDRLFVFFDVCCDNMDIVAHAGDCLCESFMKSDVASVAANSAIIPSYTIPNHDYDKEMYKALFNEGIYNIGYITNYANITVLNVHGNLGRSNVRTYLWLGDASIEPWTLTPANLTVSHDPQIFLGLSNFSVTVLGTGGAIENAMVCVSNDDQTVYGVAFTDASGYAEVVFDGPVQSPGTATVTVTAHNHLPYQSTVQIIPQSGPYVIKDSYSINDASGGNGNGLMDYGEAILLSLGVKNVGIAQATNVIVTLSTTDLYITFTDNTEPYGSVDPDEVVLINDGFAIQVANDIPDGHFVMVDVEASGDGDDIWNSSFTMEGHAPFLEVGTMTIDDSNGNANGRLDPGETVDIHIETFNNGSAHAIGVLGSLNTSSGYLTLNNSSYDFGVIGSGLMQEAVFNVSIEANAPVGTAVTFIYDATAGDYNAQETFATSIGLNVEDWETGGMGQYDWETGGNANWAVSQDNPYEGTYCIKSGDINDNQSTWFQLEYEVFNNDVVSFYYKVSSESSYDYLKFYIDNTMQGSWAGEVAWGNIEYAVTPGVHIFKWAYEKDVSVSTAGDCAWVDFIILPAPLVTTAYAGPDGFICEGDDYGCTGGATLYNAVNWTTSGTGTFDNSQQLNAVYTPSSNDIAGELVTLTLTAYGPDNTVSNDMILTINHAASANAGEDASVCSNASYELINASAENYASVNWTTSGDGSFDDNGIVNSTYTPGTADITAGTVTLMFTVSGNTPCGDTSDDIMLTIESSALAYAGADTDVCSNASLLLSEATAENYSALEWTATGDGTFNDNSLLNPEYTPGVLDASVGSVTLTLAATGIGSCGEETSYLIVMVNPAAVVFAGDDNSIKSDETYLIEDASVENYTSLIWSTAGDGAFDDVSIVNPTYSPGANDISNEGVTITMTATNDACGEVSDEMELAISTVGVNEYNSNADFSIFPNPSNGKFTVKFNKNIGLTKIIVMNTLNEIIFEQTAVTVNGNSVVFDLKDYSEGVYFVRIKSDNSEQIKKIIIQ